MNTRFLIVASFAVPALLAACTSAAPTGLDARAVAPSFELSNSADASDRAADSDTPPVDEADTIGLCPAPSADTTDVIGITGIYAVAYGTPPILSPGCTIIP